MEGWGERGWGEEREEGWEEWGGGAEGGEEMAEGGEEMAREEAPRVERAWVMGLERSNQVTLGGSEEAAEMENRGYGLHI